MCTRLVATYRVQLQPGFGFDEAAGIVDYLARLGVSHLYCSPLLQAVPGSTHGYDVVDPTRVSADLGGEAGFARLCEALRRSEMGIVLDIVPNHMAITGRENAWWWDVLENGPSGLYASHFDVDWDPPEAKFRNLILVPILGDRYGRVLNSREIRLVRDGGTFSFRYHDHLFPVAPRSLESLLAAANEKLACDELSFLAGAFGRLPLPTATDQPSMLRRHRDKAVLHDMLGHLLTQKPEAAVAVDTVLRNWNDSPQAMSAFLNLQNYRLAYWRNAERELGYRRFFDINSLVGLRVEDERVFADVHRVVLQWVGDGAVDGLRVDHVDGLRDPSAYLNRLRRAAPRAWIVVEKILQPHEKLPNSWPVDGTTGYDFLNLVGGLFVHPSGEQPLSRFYSEFTGETSDFRDVVRECKATVLQTSLRSDLNRLTALLLRISSTRPISLDFTRHELDEVLREVLVAFPAYRSYGGDESQAPHGADAAHIAAAVATVRGLRPDLDADLISFIEDLLLGRLRGPEETEFVQRFQQLSSPAMAKGVEDTAFYRFNRFVALNEVGGAPDHFGTTLEQFHEVCGMLQRHWPQTMLASSTHDTKRSEDVRARLALLSEIPEVWCNAVRRWSEMNEPSRSEGPPDHNTEYLLYQTLVGAWPICKERLLAYAVKASREAKQYTSWADENSGYEQALWRFVDGILGRAEFVADIEAFVQPLIAPGRINSLAQTLIKLTAPGVPDIYQGTELWDLSLVDPDNRRPVDYALRRRLMDDTENTALLAAAIATDFGAAKLRLISTSLSVRRRFPAAFGPDSTYRRLPVSGSDCDHVVAFERGGSCLTIAPRWSLSLRDGRVDAAVHLPPGRWRNEFTGDEFDGGSTRLDQIARRFPLALLTAGKTGSA